MMGSHIEVKTSGSTEKDPERPDASTQTELVRKKSSGQNIATNWEISQVNQSSDEGSLSAFQ